MTQVKSRPHIPSSPQHMPCVCFTILLLLSILVSPSSTAATPEASAPTPTPNILLIAIDDLRNEVGPYGFTHVHTPNMDEFAATATTFQRAYVQFPVCGPSRASMLTGRRPDTTRVRDLVAYFRTVGCDVSTLPQFFKERGYDVLGMGKIFHPGSAAGDSEAGGRSHDAPSWSEPFYWPPGPEFRGSTSAVRVSKSPESAFPDVLAANRAVETLKRLENSTKPFFVAVGFEKPHLPWVVPQRFWDMYPMQEIKLPVNNNPPRRMPEVAWQPWSELRGYGDVKKLKLNGNVSDPDMPTRAARHFRRAYWASVSFMDDQIGKVLRALDASGHRDTTTVVIWSDHGYELGEHGEWGKHVLFEDAVRAPLMIRTPSVPYSGGQVAQTVVEHVDIFPTLVELAGFVPPVGAQGRSLMSVLRGVDDMHREALTQVVRLVNPKTKAHAMGYSIRTQDWRYTVWVAWNKTDVTAVPDWSTVYGKELYDHRDDTGHSLESYENDNVVEYFSDIADDLHSRLFTGVQRYTRPHDELCVA